MVYKLWVSVRTTDIAIYCHFNPKDNFSKPLRVLKICFSSSINSSVNSSSSTSPLTFFKSSKQLWKFETTLNGDNPCVLVGDFGWLTDGFDYATPAIILTIPSLDGFFQLAVEGLRNYHGLQFGLCF